MGSILPEGFSIPEGTAFTLGLHHLDRDVWIEEGPEFAIEGSKRGLKIERAKGVIVISRDDEPVRNVVARNRSISVGRDLIGNSIIMGDNNVSVHATGYGNNISIGGIDSGTLHVTVPAPLALVLGKNVCRVRCFVPLTAVHFDGFDGQFDCRSTINGEMTGRHSAEAVINLKQG